MDMDDDFMGEIEFNLTPEQSEIVSRAIDLASRDNDEFQFINPLISIMQWWQRYSARRRKTRRIAGSDARRGLPVVHAGSRGIGQESIKDWYLEPM